MIINDYKTSKGGLIKIQLYQLRNEHVPHTRHDKTTHNADTALWDTCA